MWAGYWRDQLATGGTRMSTPAAGETVGSGGGWRDLLASVSLHVRTEALQH